MEICKVGKERFGSLKITQKYINYCCEIYFRSNGISIFSPNRKLESKKPPKNVAIFEQEVTHFNSTVVGVPVSQRIYVVNPTNSKIVFSAITSSSNFHCSFFSNKVHLFNFYHFWSVIIVILGARAEREDNVHRVLLADSGGTI